MGATDKPGPGLVSAPIGRQWLSHGDARSKWRINRR